MIRVMICNGLCRAQGNQESIGAVQSTGLGLVCVSEKYFDGRRKQDQVNNANSVYILINRLISRIVKNVVRLVRWSGCKSGQGGQPGRYVCFQKIYIVCKP